MLPLKDGLTSPLQALLIAPAEDARPAGLEPAIARGKGLLTFAVVEGAEHGADRVARDLGHHGGERHLGTIENDAAGAAGVDTQGAGLPSPPLSVPPPPPPPPPPLLPPPPSGGPGVGGSGGLGGMKLRRYQLLPLPLLKPPRKS